MVENNVLRDRFALGCKSGLFRGGKQRAALASVVAAVAGSLCAMRGAMADPPIDLTSGTQTISTTYTIGGVTSGNDAIIVGNNTAAAKLTVSSTGVLTVQDNGANDEILINGQGTFELDGGSALFGSAFSAGDSGSGTGTANIFGGTFSVSPTAGSDPSIYVGRLGTGSFLQNNSISTSSVSATNLNIGTGSATAVGTYELDAGTLSIGSAITLGSAAGGTGNLILTGGSMSSSAAALSLITGSMSVSGTASVSLASLTQSGGIYSQTGGSLTSGSANFTSTGLFTFTGGSMTINGGTWTPLKQTISVSNGTVPSILTGFEISGSGNPTLTLENGSVDNIFGGIVGDSGNSGTWNVNDSTVTITPPLGGASLIVGDGGAVNSSVFTPGSGSVTVSNGGKITSTGITSGGNRRLGYDQRPFGLNPGDDGYAWRGNVIIQSIRIQFRWGGRRGQRIGR